MLEASQIKSLQEQYIFHDGIQGPLKWHNFDSVYKKRIIIDTLFYTPEFETQANQAVHNLQWRLEWDVATLGLTNINADIVYGGYSADLSEVIIQEIRERTQIEDLKSIIDSRKRLNVVENWQVGFSPDYYSTHHVGTDYVLGLDDHGNKGEKAHAFIQFANRFNKRSRYYLASAPFPTPGLTEADFSSIYVASSENNYFQAMRALSKLRSNYLYQLNHSCLDYRGLKTPPNERIRFEELQQIHREVMTTTDQDLEYFGLVLQKGRNMTYGQTNVYDRELNLRIIR